MSNTSGKRSFTIESTEVKLPENYQGRFESKTPGSAALKACRRLFQVLKKDQTKKTEIRFALRETTMGSNHKIFHYTGLKKKLDNPVEVTRGDSTIKIEYEYKAKACK